MGLREVTDIEVGPEFDGARIDFLFAEQAADECGFARAVWADDSPALSAFDSDVELLEQCFVGAVFVFVFFGE